MKYVFFGSSTFSALVLEHLLRLNLRPLLVVTQPDKPFGRKGVLTPPPVKPVAEKASLPIYQPKSLRKKPEPVLNLEYDFGVVVAYGQILPQSVLDSAKVDYLNTHASDLPKFRGASPIHMALMEGESETALCIMSMTAGLDEGPVLLKKVIPIGLKTHFQELESHLLELACQLLPEALLSYGSFSKTPQSSEGVTYAGKITKESALVSLQWPAQKIYNRMRALSSSYGITFEVGGRKLAVFEGDFEEGGSSPAGKFVRLSRKTFGIQLEGGMLLPKRLQWEGKKVLDVADFMAGARIEDLEVDQ